MATIRSLKQGKALGLDSLNAELFQSLQHKFFSHSAAMWEEQQLLDNWTEGVIVKILKKGALSNCNNWKGVTLLPVPSKILAKLIIRWISEGVDQQLSQDQAGFHKGQGCMDQIFTLRNITEQFTEWQKQLYINCVDFEKAFNSIHRQSRTCIRRAYGIPQLILLVIKSFYNNFKYRVGNSESSFGVKTRMSYVCFALNLIIDRVMPAANNNGLTTGHQMNPLLNP